MNNSRVFSFRFNFELCYFFNNLIFFLEFSRLEYLEYYVHEFYTKFNNTISLGFTISFLIKHNMI